MNIPKLRLSSRVGRRVWRTDLPGSAAAFLLPLLILGAAFVWRGVICRGDNTLLAATGEWSLLSRLLAQKEASLSGSLFAFSSANAPFDPFFALAALLPLPAASAAVLAVMLGTGCLGLSFWCSARALGHAPFASLLCSLLWSLSSLSFVSSFAPALGTFLLLLPLAPAFCRLLLRYGTIFPLAVLLTLATLWDVRAGFLLLTFAVLWFSFDFFFLTNRADRVPAALCWMGLAVTVGAAAALSARALIDGFSAVTWPAGAEIGTRFDLLSFLMKMLPGTYDGLSAESLPYVGFGLLVLLAVPCFFADKSFGAREKIGAGILLVLTLTAASIAPLSALWDWFDGETVPGGMLAALFGFVLLFCSARVLSSERIHTPSVIFGAWGFASLLLLLAQKMSFGYTTSAGETAQVVDTIYTVWASLFLLTALAGCLVGLLTARPAKKRWIALLLLFTVGVETGYSQTKLLQSYQSDYTVYPRAVLAERDRDLADAAAYLAENGAAGHRIGVPDPLTSLDEPALGIASGTSGASRDLRDALMLLGVTWMGEGVVSYTHYSAAIDTLLGVRYLVFCGSPVDPAEEDPADQAEEERKTVKTVKEIKKAFFPDQNVIAVLPIREEPHLSPLYREVYREGNVTVWENPYAFPALFPTSADLSAIDFSRPDRDDLLRDAEGRVQGLSEAGLAKGTLLTVPDRLTAVWTLLTGDTDAEFFFPLTDCTLRSAYNSTRSADALDQTVYTATNSSNAEKSKYILDCNLPRAGQVILSIPTFTPCTVRIFVNDVYLTTLTADAMETGACVPLGYREGRCKVELYYAADDPAGTLAFLSDADMLYLLDEDSLSAAVGQLGLPSGVQVTEETENTLRATVSGARGTHVITTLPLDGGYTVEVDGELCRTYRILGDFLAFDLPDGGEHTVAVTKKGHAGMTWARVISFGLNAPGDENGRPASVAYACASCIGAAVILTLGVWDVLHLVARRRKRGETND